MEWGTLANVTGRVLHAGLAQLVARGSHNPKVASSILAPRMFFSHLSHSPTRSGSHNPKVASSVLAPRILLYITASG